MSDLYGLNEELQVRRRLEGEVVSKLVITSLLNHLFIYLFIYVAQVILRAETDYSFKN